MLYAPKTRLRHDKNFKFARAFALHLRHSKLTSLLAILITLPIFVTVILSILHPNTATLRDVPSPHSPQNIAHPFAIPHTNPNTSSITIPQYLQHQSTLHNFSNPNKSLSLLAACMNRPQSLHFSLSSWLAIPQITQIILVDWSSTPPITPTNQKHLSFIRVENAETWILSRAYNLASKFATAQYILKVDCDTYLEPTFLNNHPFPPLGKYYTAYTASHNTLSHALRGVWFARTHDFHRIGGYDERIVEYGYEDTDLYRRFNAFLQPIPLHLESVQHHTIHDTYSQDSTRSHKISTLVNAALLRNATSWGTTLATKPSTYTFSYDQSENKLYASITHIPPAVHESTTAETLKSVKTRVLEEMLHEYGLPRVLVQGLDLADQEFLAGYFEADTNNHVIVALLDSDTLGNIFNLVSALQIGITTGRPVVTIWQGLQTSNFNALIDVAGTNGRLREVVQTVSARRHGFSRASRIIAGGKWGCEDVSCTTDSAYKRFVKVGGRTVYTERNPLPISVKHHALVKLTGMKLGGEETRSLAYGCVIWSHGVTSALQTFRDDIGLVADQDVDITKLIAGVESHKHGNIGIIGRHAEVVRRLLRLKMCNGCGKNSVVGEVANVLAVIAARHVLPDVGDGKGEWAPVANLFVADLRGLHRALLGTTL